MQLINIIKSSNANLSSKPIYSFHYPTMMPLRVNLVFYFSHEQTSSKREYAWVYKCCLASYRAKVGSRIPTSEFSAFMKLGNGLNKCDFCFVLIAHNLMLVSLLYLFKTFCWKQGERSIFLKLMRHLFSISTNPNKTTGRLIHNS